MHMLAKALFDNIAESPDELGFKRGDVLSVIEQETGGLEGWWLCSLRGKQGIAPGNRLKLMTGLYAQHARSQTADFPAGNQKIDGQWDRRSWDGVTNKVVTPNRHGDMSAYNQQGSLQSDYDVPPSRYPPSSLNNSCKSNSSSIHSSREELDTSLSSFDQSLYDTPPQNRSMMSGDVSMYDTPPSQLHLDPYDTPSGSVRTSLASKLSDESMSLSSGFSKSNPPSMCDSARSSMDITPLDMYDVPPFQKDREARIAGQYPIRSSKDSGLDMYDSPPKLKSPPSMMDDYDVPRQTMIEQEREKQFQSMKFTQSEPSSPGSLLEDYDVPKSSLGSKVAHILTTSKSLEEQPGLEDYDVPKQNPIALNGKPPLSAITPKRHKSNSVGSLLDDYDTPKSSHSSKLSNDDLFSKLNQKAKDSEYKRQFSDDENNYDEPDAAVTKKVLDVRTVAINQEHAVDDLYDTPRNNAPVKNMTREFSAVSIMKSHEPLSEFDIPPQVTRDSVISSRSDSSDGTENGNQRWSNSSFDSKSMDFMIYDELPLELDAANDLVIKLQQDVQKATQKFTSLSHSSWRKKENIDQKLYDIKQACLCLGEALGEFVEFGQGTLANSAKLPDRKLINKMSKYLIPLQQALQQIRISIKHLDDVNWQVSKYTSSDSHKKDDLGMIASLAKDLTSDVRKLASFIQGNSSLLFKRAKDFKSSRSTFNEHSTPVTAGKPPISRKPALPSKTHTPPTAVQTRPLPAPPPSERPLPQPPTPTEKKSQGFAFSGPEMKRLSGDYKHWSGEFQVKRVSMDQDIETEACATYKQADLVQEYDYVELEDDDDKQNVKQTVDCVDGIVHKSQLNSSKENLLNNVLPPSNVTVGHLEMKDNDSYEKELEKTLDEINDVNIYSDDTGTLKRDQTYNITDDSGEKGGTLKREKSSDNIDTCVEYNNSNTPVKGNSEERDGGTLKRDKGGKTVFQDSEDIGSRPESIEVPVHDREPVREPVKQLLPLDPEDRQVLAFYMEQFDTHATLLTNSIEAFFSCIENNQAPKVFISHSKFVVVSAHKLVYIGDCLHKNLKHDQVRTHIIQSANFLCDILKQAVVSTKTAALQYPSVPAVQDMVDRIVDVSRSARALQSLVQQAAKL